MSWIYDCSIHIYICALEFINDGLSTIKVYTRADYTEIKPAVTQNLKYKPLC